MKRIRIGDMVILILSIAIIAASLQTYGNFTGEPEVHVRLGNNEWVYDLSVDTVVTFNGPIGDTVMEIRDGQVRIAGSDCKNKLCVSAGWKSHIDEWIACLPNTIFVTIEGAPENQEGGIDATSF